MNRLKTTRLMCNDRAMSAFVFVVLVAIGIAWAFVVPLRMQADETAHAVNAAAVARGQFVVEGHPETFGDMPITAHYVEVPESFDGVQDGAGCMLFAPEKPQACAKPIPADSAGDALVMTSAANYPPLYYFAVGWVTLLLDGSLAWYLMRIITVLLCSALYTVGIREVAKVFGWLRALAVLAVVTPTSMSYLGAINPAGMEIASCFALACALVAVAHSSQLHSRNVIAVGILAAIAIQTRPSAALWAALVGLAGVGFLSADRWRNLVRFRAFWGALGIIGVSLVAMVAWIVVAKPNDSVLGYPQPMMKAGAMLDWMNSQRGQYLQSIIGDFGWNDVIVPTGVAVLVLGVFAVLGLLSQIIGNWQERYISLIAIVITPLTGIILQWRVLDTVGLMWQGRYWLPLIVALGVYWCAILFSHASRRWSSISSVLLLIVFVTAHVWMFGAVVYRYVSGWGSPFTISAFTTVTWLGVVCMLLGSLGVVVLAIFARSHKMPEFRGAEPEFAQ